MGGSRFVALVCGCGCCYAIADYALIGDARSFCFAPFCKGGRQAGYQVAPMILGSGSMATPKRACTDSAMRRASESNCCPVAEP